MQDRGIWRYGSRKERVSLLELLIIIGGLLLDQGTKALARGLLLDLPGQSFHIIDGVFHFTYLQNSGAAFGMLAGMRPVFLVLTVLACGALVYILLAKRQKLNAWMRVSLSMILCGALGNFIDRLLFGYVRDFLHFALIDFAVFNVADSLITVGTVIFAVYVLFIADRKAKPAAEAPTADSPESETESQTEAEEQAQGDAGTPGGEPNANGEDDAEQG